MRAATVLRSGICRALAVALTALAALSAVAPAPAFAADSDQQIKTVRVGWLVSNEGFQDGTPGERLSGWGYEYLQTLSYYTPGWRYEYVSGTFTELMDMLEAGEIDLMPNISYSEERAQKLLFSSNPEGTERYYIYARPDRDDLAKGDPQALQGLTIGCNPSVMQTFVGQQWLANEGITCTYREYDGGSDLFDALANNEVDAVIMNDTTSSPNASPMFYIGSSDYYFAVPKSRPDLMNDINAAMSAIARVNPRYIDEVKSNYSAQNSGSSSLNGPERSWLKANDNTITFGYITGKLPYCNEDEDGKMEGSLASLATTLHDKFGITVKTVAFDSYKMMSKALSKGSIDAALPVYRDYWFAEQSGVVQSVSLGTVSLTAIHTGGNLNKDLQNIACTKSSFINKNALESLFPTATVTEYQSADEAFDALRKGTAHCIVAPSSRVKPSATVMISKATRRPSSLTPVSSCAGFRAENPSCWESSTRASSMPENRSPQAITPPRRTRPRNPTRFNSFIATVPPLQLPSSVCCRSASSCSSGRSYALGPSAKKPMPPTPPRRHSSRA